MDSAIFCADADKLMTDLDFNPFESYFRHMFSLSLQGADNSEDVMYAAFTRARWPLVKHQDTDVDPVSRVTLIDWLFQVALELKLDLSLVVQSMFAMDQLMCKVPVKLIDYQWLGLACLMIYDKIHSVHQCTTYHFAKYIPDWEDHPGMFYGMSEVKMLVSAEAWIMKQFDYEIPLQCTLTLFPTPHPDSIKLFQNHERAHIIFAHADRFQEFCQVIAMIALYDWWFSIELSLEDQVYAVFLFCAQFHSNLYIGPEGLSEWWLFVHQKLASFLPLARSTVIFKHFQEIDVNPYFKEIIKLGFF